LTFYDYLIGNTNIAFFNWNMIDNNKLALIPWLVPNKTASSSVPLTIYCWMLSPTSQMFGAMLYPRTLDAYCSPSKHIFAHFTIEPVFIVLWRELRECPLVKLTFITGTGTLYSAWVIVTRKATKKVAHRRTALMLTVMLKMISPIKAMAQHTFIFNMFSKS